jgi:hypothetical protein
VAIHALAAPGAAHAQAAPRLWAYCYFEGSGGVGTTIATFVTEPFEIDASREKTLSDFAFAGEFDKTGMIGQLIPGYTYFMSIGGTNCNVYKMRADAQAKVEAWRKSTRPLVRVVDWTPSAELTGLGAPANKGKPGSASTAATATPAGAAPVDIVNLTQQARERIATIAASPEMRARNEELARRRHVQRGGTFPKPAPAKPVVAATPAGATPGATLYWMCHYFNLATNTSYYSAIGSAPQDKSVTSVQETMNYRKGWVAHLQKMGLNPGAGGNCTGRLSEKDTVGELASSKAHWVANRKSRIVDTAWMPEALK